MDLKKNNTYKTKFYITYEIMNINFFLKSDRGSRRWSLEPCTGCV